MESKVEIDDRKEQSIALFSRLFSTGHRSIPNRVSTRVNTLRRTPPVHQPYATKVDVFSVLVDHESCHIYCTAMEVFNADRLEHGYSLRGLPSLSSGDSPVRNTLVSGYQFPIEKPDRLF